MEEVSYMLRVYIQTGLEKVHCTCTIHVHVHIQQISISLLSLHLRVWSDTSVTTMIYSLVV